MSLNPGGPTLVVLAAGRARRYGGCKPLAPVGPSGEPVIDILASDAMAAGFSTIILVVSPGTGPAIRYRVERCWPSDADVRFAVQQRPRGTVDAVLAAGSQLAEHAGFGVANADDVYGVDALATLREHLRGSLSESALVAFALRDSVVSDAPVTRALCSVRDGWLEGLVERRNVHPVAGGEFAVEDGLEPRRLGGGELVSVNLWGFAPQVRRALEATMAAAGDGAEQGELLLPDMVAGLVAGHGPEGSEAGAAGRFRVRVARSRCIGVTHPRDLELVQAELARQVAAGDRPSALWTSPGAAAPRSVA